MNSPYMGKFRVTQRFTLTQHDGLDLVGIDSKEIHATVNGTVQYAGWEDPNDHSQGFGQYVCLRANNRYYYYGHLSELRVKTGQSVKCTDVIGIEGSTGRSSGSHCHYEIRTSFCKNSPTNVVDVCGVSGIPNVKGGTTLDVETTVKPSEVYIKYRGEAVATLSTLSAEVSSPERFYKNFPVKEE